jgi:hypothetical protein
MMVQRCYMHPSANVVMMRDGTFQCVLCGRKLKTSSIEPPVHTK